MKVSMIMALIAACGVNGFAPMRQNLKQNSSALGIFGKFFEELDAFVDDATNRRLGNGAAFYGKRKSTFYGEQDFMKKDDKNVEDSTEDYQVSLNPVQHAYAQHMHTFH
jgi:hypothetical protein